MTRPVAGWDLPLDLERLEGQPLFRRIAFSLAEEIQRGRLASGARLPGSRALAQTLSVHRNTVVSAYEELAAEGWIESRGTRGSFVSSALPDAPAQAFTRRRRGVPHAPGFAMPAAEPFAFDPPGRAPFDLGGVPDSRLVPRLELARAYRRALRRLAGGLLDYTTPWGCAALRASVASLLASSRGVACTGEDVLITSGSQMALSLIAKALIRPGDVVAVENPGYPFAWRAFRAQGARVVPIPVDAEGLSVDSLETLTAKHAVRAVFLTPHHQLPTGVTLATPRRLRLLALARRKGIALIEDDYDHEFHYAGRPVLPLASADADGTVLYVGTLAKVLAPGLRVGYVVAPRAVLDRLAAERFFLDLQGDQVVQAAVADLIDEGELKRHLRRVRRIYEARRDAMAAVLRRALGSALSLEVPSGGQTLWARVDPAIDVVAWAREARSLGVGFQPGRSFSFERASLPFARFGFAALDEAQQREAAKRLAQAARAAGWPGPRVAAR